MNAVNFLRTELEQEISHCAESQLIGSPQAVFGSQAKRAKRVLIADDNALVRGSLAAVLECEGFQVEEAANGLESISMAISCQPDLILLDVNMPILDGWAALEKIDQIMPLVPVVVITARPHQYQRAMETGVDAFMEKPLIISALVDAIKNLTEENQESHLRRITNPDFVTQLLDENETGGSAKVIPIRGQLS